ncbi:MAG: hypothetical protein K9J50_04025 [Sulfuritalea sp.]|nr:hypothetical protein [Sulfuritalea sp.]
MKKFDPTVGWIHSNSDTASQPEAAPSQATASSAQSPSAESPGVYHFSRQGARLNISEQAPSHSENSAQALSKTKIPEVAETAELVRELFSRLDQADKSQDILRRVARTLSELDDLKLRKLALETVILQMGSEINQLQALVESDMQEAKATEERNLKISSYRHDLIAQLALKVPAAQKPF